MTIVEARAKGREYYRKYMSVPGNREHCRELARRNYAKSIESRRQYQRKHRANNLEIARRSHLNWIKTYPHKDRANTIAKRLIPLKPTCEICGGTYRLQRHHKDYGKPLEVLTLCKTCHKALEVIEPPIYTKQPNMRFYKGYLPVEILDNPNIKRGQKWPCRVIVTGEVREISVGSLCYLPHKIIKKKKKIQSSSQERTYGSNATENQECKK